MTGQQDTFRVLRVIARMNIGGPARQVILLNRKYEQWPYESLLATGIESETEGTFKDRAAELGVRTVVIPELSREISPIRDLLCVFKLYRLMREYCPHIVHTHTAKAGFVGRVAAKLAGVPVIVHTFHGHVFRNYFGPLKTAIFIYLEKLCARISDQIICISKRQRDDIVKFGVAPASQVEVIPLGFELESFAAQQRHSGRFREELNLSADLKLVGAVGRLVAVKNLFLFLDACKAACEQLPQLRIVIVGDGEQRRQLQEHTDKLGISDVVRFTGWRGDLSTIYSDLDLLVVSSLNEGTPASIIEAMAAGCPVVSTDVGGVADIIEDGVSGRLVASGQPFELAAAIVEVIRNERKTLEMAQRAKQTIIRDHSAERLRSDIDALYRRLLIRKRLYRGGEQALPECPKNSDEEVRTDAAK